MLRILATLLITMNLLSSCGQSASLGIAADPVPAPDLQTSHSLLNVAYGSDTAQRMDVYLPAGRSASTTKVMILVHGGGWTGGNKSDFNSYIESFRRRLPDYAFFNINYRLAGKGATLLPEQEADMTAALDYVRRQASYYGVDRERIVLLGASAGAHLALLQAYKHPGSGVQAVVDFFGPTDLEAMAARPWHPLVPLALQTVIGKTYKEAPETYRSFSPALFVNAQSAPTLILQGTADPVVAPSQSEALAARLKDSGVPYELQLYPGSRHGWQGATLQRSFDAVERFVGRHVR